MRHIILVIFGLIIGSHIYSQGIEFIYDLDKAFEKAEEKNKMVFVDFYTTWCGPCKKLDKEIFPTKKVGDFFNSHFICCKIQCDNNEKGAALGNKYQVVAYPTLMFLHSDGKIAHAVAGSVTVDGLIDLAKKATDPKTNQLALTNKWDSGNRDFEFVKKYFGTLRKAYRYEKAKVDFSDYFNALNYEEKTSKNTFELIKIVNAEPFKPLFTFIEENIGAFCESTEKKEVDKFISDIYLKHMQNLLIYGTDEAFEKAFKQFEAKQYPYADEFKMFYSVLQTEDNDGNWDLEEYTKRGTVFLSKYGKNDYYYTVSLTSLLGNLISKPDQGVAGIKWMENLMAHDPNPKYLSIYFYILWRNYRFEEALKVGEQIRENAIKNNKPTNYIDKQIKQIKRALDFKNKVEAQK